MEKPIRRYTGEGKLTFKDGETVDVLYEIREPINTDGTRDERETMTGRVSHIEGHPDWHPITLDQPGPFTLELKTGTKLQVTILDMDGGIRATGDLP